MVEHRRLLKAFMDRLLGAIHEPHSFCWDLYARGLISKRMLSRITSPDSPDYEDKKIVMESISSLVSVDSTKLMEFLLVLEEHPPADQLSLEMREKLLTSKSTEVVCSNRISAWVYVIMNLHLEVVRQTN